MAILPTPVSATNISEDYSISILTNNENLPAPNTEGSFLNLFAGDAISFIENETILFSGELGILNLFLIAALPAAVLLISIAAIIWSISKIAKVVADTVMHLLTFAYSILKEISRQAKKLIMFIYNSVKSSTQKITDKMDEKCIVPPRTAAITSVVCFALAFLVYFLFKYRMAKGDLFDAIFLAMFLLMFLHLGGHFIPKSFNTNTTNTED